MKSCPSFFPRNFVVLLFSFILLRTNCSDCPKWGNKFDVSLESKNVLRECAMPDGNLKLTRNVTICESYKKFIYHTLGSPVCCSAVQKVKHRYKSNLHNCFITS